MNQINLITFDGIAGTKKTYLLKKIVKKLSKSKKVSILKEFPTKGVGAKILSLVKNKTKNDALFRLGNPGAEMYLFLFLKALQYKNLEQADLTIEDRGLPSIIGYALVQRKNENTVKRFNELYNVFEPLLIKPKRTMIFTGDISAIVHRLNKRDRKSYSNDEIRLEKKLDVLLKKVSKTRSDWIVINVDNTTESEIMEKIAQRITIS